MQNPSDLATPLDAPIPRGLVRARLTEDGAQLAGEDELPPQRYPTAEVRQALRTPPPVRFRDHLPMDVDTCVAHEVTPENVRQAFTFGADEPAFGILGVEDYGWAPRRDDHGIFYPDDTLEPAPMRHDGPAVASSAVIWVAAAVGLFGGILLAAWSGT